MELKVSESPKRWLNNEEAAKYLGCKKTLLHNLRISGKIRFYKVGGLVLYDINDIDRLVIKNKVI